MNWWCCNNCGWSVVPLNRRDKVVFFHNQDNEEFVLGKIKNRPLFLSWAGDGGLICSALTAAGLRATLPRSPDVRIMVYGANS
jgi:hypothetical protein